MTRTAALALCLLCAPALALAQAYAGPAGMMLRASAKSLWGA